MSDVSLISRQRIQTLYPGIRPLVFRVIQDMNARTRRDVSVAQALRTFEEQLAEYAKGRSDLGGGRWVIVDKRQIVTNAKPGLSWHCYGLALDFAFVGTDPYLQKLPPKERDLMWSTLGEVGKSYGFKWGGDFRLVNGVRDLPHLEMTYGLSLDQAIALHEHGGVPAVWAYIDGLGGNVA
jgi:peptidoglycan L-alanyl-D-glutamate endopeptidase CwlK